MTSPLPSIDFETMRAGKTLRIELAVGGRAGKADVARRYPQPLPLADRDEAAQAPAAGRRRRCSVSSP